MDIEEIATQIKSHISLNFEPELDESFITENFCHDNEFIYVDGTYIISYKTAQELFERETITKYEFDFISFIIEEINSDYQDLYTESDRYNLGVELERLFEDEAKDKVND